MAGSPPRLPTLLASLALCGSRADLQEAGLAQKSCQRLALEAREMVTSYNKGRVAATGVDSLVHGLINCALATASWLELGGDGRGDDPSGTAGAAGFAALQAVGEAFVEVGRFARSINGFTMRHCLSSCADATTPAGARDLRREGCPRELVAWPVTASGAVHAFNRALYKALAMAPHEHSQCVPQRLAFIQRCADAVAESRKGRRHRARHAQAVLEVLVVGAAQGVLALRWECMLAEQAADAILGYFRASLRVAQDGNASASSLLPSAMPRPPYAMPPRPPLKPHISQALEHLRASCSPTARDEARRAAAGPSQRELSADSLCVSAVFLGERHQRLWMDRTLDNKERYARRHGHPLHVLTEPLSQNFFYDASEWPRRLLGTCDAVYRSDADAVFTASAASLLDILRSADPGAVADLVVTRDERRAPQDPQHHAVNLGNYFVRNTSCADAVLNAISQFAGEEPHPYWCNGPLRVGEDQCALEVILGEAGLGESLGGAIRRVPHRTFNAMLSDKDYSCADPVLHRPGCRDETCADHLIHACPLA